MKIFARMIKAFYAYEQRLARQPVTWPPTTHATPDLWYRVRELFKQTLDTIGSALRLAWRRTLTRTERSELLIRLVPVEKTVRMLLMVEALTFLLMTPEGLKIRREAKTIAIPNPPPPPGKPKIMSERDRLHALALQGLAVQGPYIDPHIETSEERERREAREARKAAWRDANPFGDPLQRAPFRVIGWQFDKPLAREIVPTRRVWATNIDITPGFTFLGPAPRPVARVIDTDADDAVLDTGPGLALARRIAALIRVLDNPWPVIRRLARQLASFPREAFAEPAVNRFRAAEWWHGRPEYYNATSLAAQAWRAFARTEAKLEPG